MASRLEKILELQIKAARLPVPVRELQFHPGKKFRFDFAWTDLKFAVECQGGIWRKKGAHNTGKAILRDCEKNALALLSGWRVMVVATNQIESGEALSWIKEMIEKLQTTTKTECFSCEHWERAPGQNSQSGTCKKLFYQSGLLRDEPPGWNPVTFGWYGCNHFQKSEAPDVSS